MKTALTILLLCCFTLLPKQLHAQQSAPSKKKITELKKKAEKGDAESQYLLGACYLFGDGVKENVPEGLKWVTKAAEQKHLTAMGSLGEMYQTGQFVEKNLKEGVNWYRKAAELGAAQAQAALAHCYLRGEGTPKDLAEAVKWFRKAAEQNYPNAQVNLGECYAAGEGVPKDIVEGYAWILLGAKGEPADVMVKNNTAKRMTKEQITKASKRAEELKKEIEGKLKSAEK